MKKILIYLSILVLSINGCKSQKTKVDKTTVKAFDINRYLGTWYEISRYDHSFERGLVGVTATYSFRKDGKIKVINKGYKQTLNGDVSEAIGKAKIPNLNEPSKLKVSFFWIFYSDYLVLELDENYQWAVVGSRSDKYLWILSRSPQMQKHIYKQILKKLGERGYDTNKLILVEQNNTDT